MSYELIETVELTSSASSIEFTSIPQDGTDLVLVISSRRDIANSFQTVSFNGDVGGNYDNINLTGDGSSAASSTNNGAGYIRAIQNKSDATANTFSNTSVYVSNYAKTTSYKSASVDAVTENNATAAEQFLVAGVWKSNDAITSVSISGLNIVAGSTASLYKIS